MKRLLLFRHAKSSWDQPLLRDHERPLADRGRRAAPEMARQLLALEVVPEFVLCSDAVRTRQTWALIRDEWAAAGISPDAEIRPELYLASPRAMLDAVASSPDEVATVMVVAHNPGTHDLARRLSRFTDGDEVEALAAKFPTAAVAIIDSDAPSWTEFDAGRCTLERFIRPKDLTV